MARLLVIGGGGREHALVWSLAREGRHQLFCAPGNAGTADLATNVPLDGRDLAALAGLVRDESIDLTVVGPEAPLAEGIVDQFQQGGLDIFGPVQAAARLESSKLFARRFMRQLGIPHPDFRAADSPAEARAAAADLGLPVVLKADGLAAGKGVMVCTTAAEVDRALETFFTEQAFGPAGMKLSVEECLVGTEMSVFAICDGERAVIMGTAQDYKRARDGDEGPNTGGMGAIAPSPLADDALLGEVAETILQPTLEGMRSRGTPYVGFLYAGLMIVDGRPFVIEFNVRLGDPETQVVLPLLDVPLYDLLRQAMAGRLPDTVPVKPGAALCVVLAADGYPGKYERGKPISDLERLDEGLLVFHAGTSLNGSGGLVSSGGRVLNVAALDESVAAAADQV
ncbi:MAG: phosphoribosylamine--glycine ligase, partial [Candidatus Neomarinimicrobiota bacterium]